MIAGINIQQKSPAEKAGLFCVCTAIFIVPFSTRRGPSLHTFPAEWKCMLHLSHAPSNTVDKSLTHCSNFWPFVTLSN